MKPHQTLQNEAHTTFTYMLQHMTSKEVKHFYRSGKFYQKVLLKGFNKRS